VLTISTLSEFRVHRSQSGMQRRYDLRALSDGGSNALD
jgi:hypothetical protein